MVWVAKNWQQKPSKFNPFCFLLLSNRNRKSDLKSVSKDCYDGNNPTCKDLEFGLCTRGQWHVIQGYILVTEDTGEVCSRVAESLDFG